MSILIPAFNAQEWIADTIRSALAQTWPRKEIIVVDDGSQDQTFAVARHFASKDVFVISKSNEGAAATRNKAYSLSQGDYIQWLDADDQLAPDKIERQLAALGEGDHARTLLSSAWAKFAYRPQKAKFVPTPLWRDLTPVEWLLHKMGENLFMQTATWLTSRELTEVAGPWDTRLTTDDDGEYFCRVILASNGIRFVPDSRVYYRDVPYSHVSYIGTSKRKTEALVLSTKLHIRYLRSLEDSARVRKACLNCLRFRGSNIYPGHKDQLAEMQKLANELGGTIEFTPLRWKYAWLSPVLGQLTAWRAQLLLPQFKARVSSLWDRLISSPKTRSVDFDRTSQATDPRKKVGCRKY